MGSIATSSTDGTFSDDPGVSSCKLLLMLNCSKFDGTVKPKERSLIGILVVKLSKRILLPGFTVGLLVGKRVGGREGGLVGEIVSWWNCESLG